MTDKELILKLQKELKTARKAAATWQSKYQQERNEHLKCRGQKESDMEFVLQTSVTTDGCPWD